MLYIKSILHYICVYFVKTAVKFNFNFIISH